MIRAPRGIRVKIDVGSTLVVPIYKFILNLWDLYAECLSEGTLVPWKISTDRFRWQRRLIVRLNNRPHARRVRSPVPILQFCYPNYAKSILSGICQKLIGWKAKFQPIYLAMLPFSNLSFTSTVIVVYTNFKQTVTLSKF